MDLASKVQILNEAVCILHSAIAHRKGMNSFILSAASPGGKILQNSSYTATYHTSRKLSKLDELDRQDTAGKVKRSS